MPDPISWAFSWPYLLAAFVGAYLLGSVPFGLILTRFLGGGDLRAIGSGNIGAANVLRTGKRGLAAATLALDAGKGALAVLVGQSFGPDTAVTAGFGALLGHCFPVWLHFRGGKGVATGLGVLIVLAPAVGIAASVTWLAVALAWRISSLASMTAAALSPLYAWALSDVAVAGQWLANPQITEMAVLLAAIIIVRHHANIVRLIKGREPRFGDRGRPARGEDGGD